MIQLNPKDYFEVMEGMLNSVTTLSVHAFMAFQAHESNLPYEKANALAKNGQVVSEKMAILTERVPTTNEEHLELLACTLDALKHCEFVFSAVEGILTSEEDKKDVRKNLIRTYHDMGLIRALADVELTN